LSWSFSPATIYMDFVISCLFNAAPIIFFIAFAMLSVRAVEGVLLLYHRDHCSLHVATRCNLNKVILHHECAALRIRPSMFPVRFSVLSFGS
jgi:hypothetical protein